MTAERYKVLLVDDSPDDARLVREMLSSLDGFPFDLECVDGLPAALERLAAGEFDVLVLDLGSQGTGQLEAIAAIRADAPGVPVVALTSIGDETAGLEAIRAGAQDHVVKGWCDGNVLSRSIRHAVERQSLLTEVMRQQQQQTQMREIDSLERMAASAPAAVAATAFGVRSLRENAPLVFDELVGAYSELLDLALERSAYKVDHDLSSGLRSIADRLGLLKAGPRDVVEVHSTALKARAVEATPERAQAYVQEGRLTLLELMGYLASHYRSYSTGFESPAVARGATAEAGGQTVTGEGS